MNIRPLATVAAAASLIFLASCSARPQKSHPATAAEIDDILKHSNSVVIARQALDVAASKPHSMGIGVLERDFVSGLKVIEVKNAAGHVLQISGLCMHSAYVVDLIVVQKIKDRLNLMVYLKLVSSLERRKSGSFSYTLKLRDDIQVVSFGEKRVDIWRRDGMFIDLRPVRPYTGGQ